MEWTDISITVAKRDADTAEAIATMVANGGIYIEDYSDLEQQAWEIAHVDPVSYTHLVPTGEPASIVWPRWAVTVFNPNR